MKKDIKDTMTQHLHSSAGFLEIIMALIIGGAVILGIPDLFKYIVIIIQSPRDISYEVFQEFLKHVLLLVVGLELMMMVVTHSHESMLTLVLFVIARKMLIYAHGMTEILLGTVSIGIIFFVMRFFTKDDHMLAKFDNTFSAAIPVEKIRREYGYNLPTERSHTLGGLIYDMTRHEGVQLEEGLVLNAGNCRLTIVKMNDGVIDRVLIEEI